MRTLLCVVVWIMVASPVWAKSNDKAANESPKNPQALLDAAAPLYDFLSPELKPWHLKATYQLFDENGKPTEQGTYEYWWASPKVYRSTWVRAGASESEWHTADGKYATKQSGERLRFFERDLPMMLFSPLPNEAETDPKDVKLDLREVKLGKVRFPCVTPIPKPSKVDEHGLSPIGGSSTYCFDPNAPALRFTYWLGEVTTEYDRMAKMQNRYLPLLVRVASGQKMLFSVAVGKVDGIKPDDPALVPAKDAEVKRPPVFKSEQLVHDELVERKMPIYPEEAKTGRKQGTVALAAIIGTDGKIKDLEMIASPWPVLTKAAIEAVSTWRYKPYILNGKPVEVETTIDVIFSLSR